MVTGILGWGAIPKLYDPRDPGTPKLGMVSWNLNTMHFVSVMKDTPCSSTDVR